VSGKSVSRCETPTGSATRIRSGLACVPYRDDFLRFRDRLALGLGAFRFRRSTCGGSLTFLATAVRTHGGRLPPR
jgi:hypothetical protein